MTSVLDLTRELQDLKKNIQFKTECKKTYELSVKVLDELIELKQKYKFVRRKYNV